MRADKIKLVLARLHLHEAGNGGDRVAAYKAAIVGSDLTQEERSLLRQVTHIRDDEVCDAD